MPLSICVAEHTTTEAFAKALDHWAEQLASNQESKSTSEDQRSQPSHSSHSCCFAPRLMVSAVNFNASFEVDLTCAQKPLDTLKALMILSLWVS